MRRTYLARTNGHAQNPSHNHIIHHYTVEIVFLIPYPSLSIVPLNSMKLPAAFAALVISAVQSFTVTPNLIIHNNNILQQLQNTRYVSSSQLRMTIVSPFDNSEDADSGDGDVATATYEPLPSDDEPLELTWDNVDMVLDEMRPYLLQDGGNVAISEIDGPIVRLELQVCSVFVYCRLFCLV